MPDLLFCSHDAGICMMYPCFWLENILSSPASVLSAAVHMCLSTPCNAHGMLAMLEEQGEVERHSPLAGMGSDGDDTAASITARLCLLCRSAVSSNSLLSELLSSCCWRGLLGAACFAALQAVLNRYWRLFELSRAVLTCPVTLWRSRITCPGGCMPTSDSSMDIPVTS